MVNTHDPPAEDAPDPAAQPEDRLTTVCPDCGGVLTEEREAGVAVWRCRVGHRYSPEHLVEAQATDIESALWAAIRALEDRVAVLERLASQMESRGNELSARSFRGRARAATEQAGVLRDVLAQASMSSLSSVTDTANDLAEEA